MKQTIGIVLWLLSVASLAMGALLYAILSKHPNGAVIWLIPLGFLIMGLALNPLMAVNLLGGKRRKAAIAIAACLLSLGGALFLASGLGQYYFAIRDTPDYVTAIPLLTIGAYAGSAVDANNLGVAYLHGLGVTRDIQTAKAWFIKASDRGSVDAKVSLGSIYSQGLAGQKDEAEARAVLKQAVEMGSAPAAYNLGLLYEHGKGGIANYGEAAKYYKIAAEAGISEGEVNFAVLMMNGKGVGRDMKQAREMLVRASKSPNKDIARLANENIQLIDSMELAPISHSSFQFTVTGRTFGNAKFETYLLCGHALKYAALLLHEGPAGEVYQGKANRARTLAYAEGRLGGMSDATIAQRQSGVWYESYCKKDYKRCQEEITICRNAIK